MSGLFSSLNASANTLVAFERALDVTQNNITNASTPGYASQNSILAPLPFVPEDGTSGGLRYAGTQSLRDEYSERYVQQQNSALGTAEATVSSLSGLQDSFDISGNSGIDAALTQFSSNFSALAQDPNSSSARQLALSSAQSVVLAFQDVANATAQASQSADQQISSTVSRINDLASQIQHLNTLAASSGQPDPNREATLHNDLESLSELVDFTTSFAADGTVTVLIGGQRPLVLGQDVYPIETSLAPSDPNAAQPSGLPSRIILDSNGTDITNDISSGQLGGLLQTRNVALASIQGDTTQVGSLNQLAKAFADRVNSLLTGGQVSAGPPPIPGVPIFQYDASNETGVARGLSVTSITADQIATIDPGPPSSFNGLALKIAALPSSTAPEDQIGGQSFSSFYGSIAANLGQQLSTGKTDQEQQTQAVAQARSLRSQVSGVSLDQEAVTLLNFQRSYQASSKLVSVLDELTQTTIDLIR